MQLKCATLQCKLKATVIAVTCQLECLLFSAGELIMHELSYLAKKNS